MPCHSKAKQLRGIRPNFLEIHFLLNTQSRLHLNMTKSFGPKMGSQLQLTGKFLAALSRPISTAQNLEN